MTSRQRALRQPEGRSRKKPGMGGHGNYYRVIVRPKSEFVTFRTHDVGRSGHTQRITGKRSSGSWATHTWLISKDDAHVKDEHLKADDVKIKRILQNLRGPIKKLKGSIFHAKPRKNIPEKDKPTKKQKQSRQKKHQESSTCKKKLTLVAQAVIVTLS